MAQKEAWRLRQRIIGVLLRQARLDAGKTLKECGQVLGLSSGMLSAIEFGRRAISLPELEMLAYFLQVPLDHLLNGGTQPARASAEAFAREELLVLRHRIIGAQLRRARLEQDLSQNELAKKVGLPRGRMSQYELGERPIPLVELEMLAETLELPLTYFLDEGIGPIGEQQQREKEWQRFTRLPADVRAFVLEPTNLGYLQLAMSLSDVPAEGLRDIAASLLEITL